MKRREAAEDRRVRVWGGGRCKATWNMEFKLPWREAGPPNHHDDKVDSDQEVVNKELSLWGVVKAAEGGVDLMTYRGTSLISHRPPLGPYRRTMPRLLWRS